METRTVRLWDALPPFLKRFREFRELLSAEEPELQRLADDCAGAVDELFIQTATDVGLGRFERLLGIGHAPGASLDARRDAVMTRWNDVSVYTVAVLKRRIAGIQGDENVSVAMVDGAPYEIAIGVQMERPDQIKNLLYVLDSMLPANLKARLTNALRPMNSASAYAATAASGLKLKITAKAAGIDRQEG